MKLGYIYLIFHILPCFRVKVDSFKVSGALIFQNRKKITWKFVSNMQIWHILIGMIKQKLRQPP